jgi:hypothetical protein
MKGATALPWLKIINPPKMAMTKMIGRSQNFFRTRRNIHSSFTKLIIVAAQN